jgi:hypothetical protein
MNRKVVFLALSFSGAFACASKILPTDDQWVAAQAGAGRALSASAPDNPDPKVRAQRDEMRSRILATSVTSQSARGHHLGGASVAAAPVP